MTQPKRQDAEGWYELAKHHHYEKKDYEEALSCYEQAYKLDPAHYKAWNGRGNALRSLDRNQEAIDSFEEALRIKDDYHNAWNNRGLALHHLGTVLKDLKYYHDAIASFDKALELKPNYFNAWCNQGDTWRKLEDYDEAIKSYDCALQWSQNQYWQAWNYRGWAFFAKWEYPKALDNWKDGLQKLKQENQKGRGELHYSKGRAQYLHGLKQDDPFPHWRDAASSYQAALKCLTFEQFPDRHLIVLESLITVFQDLGQTDAVQKLLLEGSDLLGRLLQQTPSDVEKIRIARKFAGFDQLRVDALAQLGNWYAALELAEQRKNLYLHWLRYNRWVDPINVEACLAVPLLNYQTAAIYWHISPAAITTFLLKHNQLSLARILTADTTSAGADRQLQKFEEWVKKWNDLVEMGFIANTTDESRKLIPDILPELAEILDIPAILPMLEEITQLVLIPHRDLHLLPLHTLFPDEVTITYLPSIQVGIDLQQSPVGAIHELPLLSIEHPETAKSQDKVKKFDAASLLYAEIESAAISQLYQPVHRLAGGACTLEALIQASQQIAGIFHFTGHAYHNIISPADSALLLANTAQLTLRDIFENELDFSRYHLICLSACETGKTGKQGLIDEFVGLAAGFLAAGAPCVVSTLWRVDEISAALIMIRFYQLLETFPPPTALRKAQLWLRDATYTILGLWCLDVANKLANYDFSCSLILKSNAASYQKKANTMDANHRPYAHPYYWAAFTITGNLTL